MLTFHGSDTVALDGSETLKAVANFVASAQRGSAQRRTSLLNKEMRELIGEDESGNLVVSYLAFCDLLGRRTLQHSNVMMREVSMQTVLRRIRGSGKVNGLRRIGLDVQEMSMARFGKGDVLLLITKKFKHNDEKIPGFFRERATEPSMAEIFADGARIVGKVAANG